MKISIVTTEPPQPPTAGNRARIASFISELEKMGHEIRILLINCEDDDIQATSAYYNGRVDSVRTWELQSAQTCQHVSPAISTVRWLRRTAGPLLDDRLKIWKRPKERQSESNIDNLMPEDLAVACADKIQLYAPDAVIVNYVYNSRVLDYLPAGIRKIIDTHDVLTNRYDMFRAIGMPAQFHSYTKEAEQFGLNRADHIVAITDEEKAFFETMDAPPCTVIGHIDDMAPETQANAARSEGPFTFSLLGSKNLLNKASLDWLLNEVLIQSVLQKEAFRIQVGGNIKDLYRKIRIDSRVEMLGRVEYDEFYGASDVVLNPMRVGTGLKIKTCEALSYAKPLITTSSGASGLTSGAGSAFLLADSPEAFADAMVRCIQDESLCAQLSRDGAQFMNEYVIKQRSALRQLFR